MKSWKKGLAWFLAAGMILPLAVPGKVQAAQENTPKQEVVYTNLTADGTVSEVYVVNIFDLEADGEILDYGPYTEVRNMNTEDELHFREEQLTAQAKAGKLYYEGTLESAELPWIFHISYELDGESLGAQELAGKSGTLKIVIQIRQNPNGNAVFFENYALQASVTLDSNRTQNLNAEGATIANVGADKQVTFTVLPGKETDLEITADVVDFEMDAIAINGLPLSMDVEVDDEELLDRIRELQDAVEKLDDGALELQDGVKELKDGVDGDLQSGINDLKSGADKLKSGASDLKSGADTVKSGASDLKSGADELKSGASDLKDGADTVNSAAGLVKEGADAVKEGADSLKNGIDQVQAGLTALNAQSEALSSGSASVASALTQMNTVLNVGIPVTDGSGSPVVDESGNPIMADSLKTASEALAATLSQMAQMDPTNENMVTLAAQYASMNQVIQGLAGSMNTLTSQYTNETSGLHAGIVAYTQGVGTALSGTNLVSEGAVELQAGAASLQTGASSLYAGTSELSEGAGVLKSGTSTLSSGASALKEGTKELSSGAGTLKDGTSALRDGVSELDDGVADLRGGVNELYDGTVEMKDGTAEMWEETKNMDSEVTDQIDEMLADITGSLAVTPSFVSERNTNVEAVQFVIQTEAVEMEETEEAAQAEEETLSFWQRLLQLFGF